MAEHSNEVDAITSQPQSSIDNQANTAPSESRQLTAGPTNILQSVTKLLVCQQLNTWEESRGTDEANKYKVIDVSSDERSKQVLLHAVEDSSCVCESTVYLTVQLCNILVPVRPFSLLFTPPANSDAVRRQKQARNCHSRATASRFVFCAVLLLFTTNYGSCLVDCAAYVIVVIFKVKSRGQLLGTVAQQWHPDQFLRLAVYDSSDTRVATIYGPFINCGIFRDVKYTASDVSGTKIATIKKKWTNLPQEVSSDLNQFTLEFGDARLSVAVKSLLISAVFLIDYMFYESNCKCC